MIDPPVQDYVRPADGDEEPIVTLINQKNLITSKFAEDSLGCRKLVLDRYIPTLVSATDEGFSRLLQLIHNSKNKVLFLIRIIAVVLPKVFSIECFTCVILIHHALGLDSHIVQDYNQD